VDLKGDCWKVSIEVWALEQTAILLNTEVLSYVLRLVKCFVKAFWLCFLNLITYD
jgi:hypothetical protein